jgi:AraC-like DNA-binding protein
MEHAKYLLEQNTASVADISSMVGYPNANSFTRAFKRHESITPTAYQRNLTRTSAQTALP